ncbi:response regulator transcription factor [Mucilaginibacter phyllosphaerae]|nr:response regulator transcription factor [Mucilaginibacter phyllosphaerae]MBB3968469.1 DNA-binding NarL/FixJ family response regulator [Mucilaginibacter phyllosphaerae]
MSQINIAIVDDQNLFRQSLALLINSIENFSLVAECSGGQVFINALNKFNMAVDVAIIDMDMPGMNGIELNKYLQANYPKIKVIVLTVHASETLITQMIGCGASGYLAKNCDRDELLLAVNTVHKTGFYFNAEVIKALRTTAGHRLPVQDNLNGLRVSLSKRERQILTLICQEFNNAEIATELNVSIRTVEGHKKSLIDKANCRNIAGLVLFALKYRLFESPL